MHARHGSLTGLPTLTHSPPQNEIEIASILLPFPRSTQIVVATGWTGVDMSTPLLLDGVSGTGADPMSFLGVGVGQV